MNAIEIIWEAISPEIQDTKFWVPTVLGFVIALVTGRLFFKLKQRRYRTCLVSMAIGVIGAEYIFLMKWDWRLYFLAGLLVLGPTLYFLINLLKNQYRLNKIPKVCRQHSYVEALNLLDSIKLEQLIPWQFRNYRKKRFFLLVNLGSLRKAKTYLEANFPEHGAFYHFALHILAFYSGDLETSFCEIQKAHDSEDLKKDPSLHFQIIMNYGVCYAAEKKYHLADEYYRKAIAFYDDRKLRNSELLETFYYDFAFNCLRLDPSKTDWQTVLDDCQSRLNMKKVESQISMLNLNLELLREAEAPRETIDELLKKAFATITESKLPLKNQIFVASSAARVAWAALTNPLPFLNFLNGHLWVMDGLPPAQRHRVYTELDTLFRDFYESNDNFTSLRHRVASYIESEAEDDLRKWQGSLPEEAVYERCDCLRKLAIVYRNKTPYNPKNVVDLQQNVIQLYHDNELGLDELHTLQDVMDELLDERNRDSDYRPIFVDEIRAHLSTAENLLPQLTGHPALAETYLRLGCYCFELDEYEKSIEYVRLFWSANISIQNFSPWLRRYYAMLLFRARVIMFDQAIKAAASDERIRTFEQDIQDWFSTYPRHDGAVETMLLGRFLPDSIIKFKLWIPEGETEPHTHTWLWIPELGLNIDLTYPQFSDDSLCRCMFFYKDRHPFEAGTSIALQRSHKDSSLFFPGVYCSQADNDLTADRKILVDTIYDFICSFIPQDCPTIEDFDRLIQEFVGPVPIPTH